MKFQKLTFQVQSSIETQKAQIGFNALDLDKICANFGLTIQSFTIYYLWNRP